MSERKYRHYKNGHVYTLLNDAVYFEGGNSDAVREHRDNRYVTYSDPQTGQVWLRPHHEFFGAVYVKELGQHVQRFTRLIDEPGAYAPDPNCTSCKGTGRYFDASHFASMACVCHIKTEPF